MGYGIPHRESQRLSRGQKNVRAARDWQLPDEWVQWAMRECGRSCAEAEGAAASFADYWHAKPGAAAGKLDWLATWRNWCRNERLRRPYAHGPQQARRSPLDVREARDRDMIAALAGRDPMRAPDDVFDLQPEEVRHFDDRPA
ncbi:hypothetical protein R75461_08029 [Paraburkholderia nemoris]|uniref:hypothetical protein n=1 Tax=Paraburkholderia nemoris TaxID=2793076 RepID=UPI00190CD1C3|nr:MULTISPECIES: hypothetical protein [Paraburkholderia]CAE6861901.1 hypothetical protein R75461_08029 [Paraburkholderia nemoris]